MIVNTDFTKYNLFQRNRSEEKHGSIRESNLLLNNSSRLSKVKDCKCCHRRSYGETGDLRRPMDTERPRSVDSAVTSIRGERDVE